MYDTSLRSDGATSVGYNAGPGGGTISLLDRDTRLLRVRATSVCYGAGSGGGELAFLNEDTQLLQVTYWEFRIWNIHTSMNLWVLDRSRYRPVPMTPDLCPNTIVIKPHSSGDHFQVVQLYACIVSESLRVNSSAEVNVIEDGPTRIRLHTPPNTVVIKSYSSSNLSDYAQFSASVIAEDFNVNRSAEVNVINGQPTFLEVREDTLWELDHSFERPLCWLPISWRKAFESNRMIWSGAVLVFGLGGGDIGVLKIDALRRQCTSTRRARVLE